MAFTTGTAADHIDLLDKLRTYLTVTLGTPWTSLAYTAGTKRATAAAVNDGGSDYAVNNTITLTGGTFTQAVVLTVTSVSAGAVTGVNITTAGVYSVTPSNPVAQGSTTGSGTGATFNMTFNYIPTDLVSVNLRGPGNGSGSEAFVNIDTPSDSGNGYYAWRIYGATGYVASTPHGSQPGASTPVFFNLSQNTMTYWFYANSRRFIVVVKTGTNYMSMYAGFILPNALPSEYPQPNCIIASYPSLDVPGVNNARNSSIADPGDGAALYYTRGAGTWREIENQASSTSSILPRTGQRAFMWPHKTGLSQSASGQTTPDDWSAAGFHLMKTNALGESVLIQCQIFDMVDAVSVGALEGVFSTTGFGRTTEQTLTSGSRTWRLFQRVNRNQPGDFYAIEEV